MEFELKTIATPGKYEISNFEEIKQGIKERLASYEKVVVLDDEDRVKAIKSLNEKCLKEVGEGIYENITAWLTINAPEYTAFGIEDDFSTLPCVLSISEAKNEKAALNKLTTTLNSERLAQERAFLKPFNVGKGQINEIITMVKDVSNKIADITNGYELAEKENKKKEITKIFESLITPNINYIKLDKIFNDKWLNKGSSLKNIEAELKGLLSSISNDYITLKATADGSSEKLAVMELSFMSDYSLANAIIKGNEFIHHQEEVRNRQIIEEVITPTSVKTDEKIYTLTFQVEATRDEVKMLSNFLKSNNYKYKQLKENN